MINANRSLMTSGPIRDTRCADELLIPRFRPIHVEGNRSAGKQMKSNKVTHRIFYCESNPNYAETKNVHFTYMKKKSQ